ncbi:type II toxin-antitoxin system death-on-curing family toxin [Limosilactobacillus ingluviei]|uniref:type II toxin-antitoxin system death-on-curing family toxin n=1 Tax=Limosilactobacillus ingluviei TaxID=148604 RepID=UPI0023F069CB|nr:type II toxin-antitoxin system death-on-curing family toxin [Limosilactobacillus ingluviei]
MKYLTANEIIQINRHALTKIGQTYRGIQYPEGLDLVVEQPQMVVFGHELYPTVWIKAAYILQKITKKHIFADGNKRTAFLSASLFLYKNGYLLNFNDDEVVALVLNVTLADDSEEEMLKLAEVLKEYAQAKP